MLALLSTGGTATPPRAQAEQDAEHTFDRLTLEFASTDQRSRYVWQGQAEHLADSLAKADRVMVTGRLRQRSWETPEGDKPSVTEIEADEVGASLKWATAKVERTSQRGNGDRTQARERQAERGGDFNDAPPFHRPVPAVTAPGFGRGRRLSQTSWLNASNKLAFQAAAAGGEALLVHADTYGGAPPRPPREHPRLFGLRQLGGVRTPGRRARRQALVGAQKL